MAVVNPFDSFVGKSRGSPPQYGVAPRYMVVRTTWDASDNALLFVALGPHAFFAGTCGTFVVAMRPGYLCERMTRDGNGPRACSSLRENLHCGTYQVVLGNV